MDKAPDAFRTISEVAADLDVPQHVLRFWETRFSQIRPMKRGGGRRYYRPDDMELLRGIRHLLYGEGYTIRGVQRILKDHGTKFVQTVWQSGAPQPDREPGDGAEAEDAAAQADANGDDHPHPAEVNQQPVASAPAHAAARSGHDRGSASAVDSGRGAEPSAKPRSRSLATPVITPAGPAVARTSSSREDIPREAKEGAAPSAQLSAEARQRLDGILDELIECRRLLDAALRDEE